MDLQIELVSFTSLITDGKKELLKKLCLTLKSDSHVSENFCQIKIFPSPIKKIPSFVCLVLKNENK